MITHARLCLCTQGDFHTSYPPAREFLQKFFQGKVNITRGGALVDCLFDIVGQGRSVRRIAQLNVADDISIDFIQIGYPSAGTKKMAFGNPKEIQLLRRPHN